jgi:glycosyltransferase involved in cell wall biosynthesis
VPTSEASLALAHDYLLTMRGAERTFAEIADCWPRAPIYTLLYDEAAVADGFAGRDVRSSRLQRLGAAQKTFRYLLPLFGPAAERLPVGGYETIVTSSSAFAHGIRPAPGALHVCYCHSPFRYAWFERERALAEAPAPLRPLLDLTLRRIRRWDLEASRRVGRYVANGEITRQRIAELYGRDSDVVHPPVSVERFAIGAPEDYLLFVGQVIRHKRVEVAIEAALIAGRPLKIVGDGPDLERLKERHAGDPVEFCGRVDDDALAGLYARCLALIVPNVEEFGIAAVEAQAAGRPVVAVGRGGVRETVVDGVTGVLVDGESAADLAAPLRAADFDHFDPAAIRANAERFSAAAFRTNFKALVERYEDEWQPSKDEWKVRT